MKTEVEKSHVSQARAAGGLHVLLRKSDGPCAAGGLRAAAKDRRCGVPAVQRTQRERAGTAHSRRRVRRYHQEKGGRCVVSYYRVCPDCGAHLDPGERCDCKEKDHPTRQRRVTHRQEDFDCPSCLLFYTKSAARSRTSWPPATEI